MRIITSGKSYLDIDAYGCCVAYAELLNLQGVKALAVSSATLNESISKTIRSWDAPLLLAHEVSADDDFVLVDVSEPQFFDKIVDHDRIVEIIDHHVGFEDVWQQRIGDAADIEFIGAACTQIYERWVRTGLIEKMSQLSARLLVCGILDNTLNFGAKITTRRDVDAYEALLEIAALPDDWTATYFRECEEDILRDPSGSLRNDTKTVAFQRLTSELHFGQLTIWDAKKLLDEHQQVIEETMAELDPAWMVNLISVGENKSYFISHNSHIQQYLTSLIGLAFHNSIAVSDRLWLRKEIIKQDIDTRGPSP